jgi:hypothetical protein
MFGWQAGTGAQLDFLALNLRCSGAHARYYAIVPVKSAGAKNQFPDIPVVRVMAGSDELHAVSVR